LFFTLFLIAILADIIIFSDSATYACKKTFLFSNLNLFFLALCITSFFIIIILGGQKDIRVKIYLCLIVASILLFVVQLFMTFHMYFYTGWDAGRIRDTIYEIISNPHVSRDNLYPYSRYPNNINLSAILLVIEKLFSHFGSNGYFGWLMVSNLLVNLAGVFTFLSTYNITHKASYAAISWIIYALLVGLSPWISIPYSDTYSILFPILAFYLYLSRKPNGKNYARWFLIGFFCFLGYTIKPTAIIVLIAILVIEFWKVFTRFDKEIILKKLVSFILIVAASLPVFLISLFSRNLLGIVVDKNQEFTLYHYAVMGLNKNTDGIYSNADVAFSRSFSTVKDRNDANIAVIKERLSDFGLFGYIKFLARKALVNFSDGTFCWTCEGTFFYKIIERGGKITTFVRDLYYPDGKYRLLFSTGVQVLWFVALILLAGIGLLFKNPEYKSVGVILIILGISSFVMLFEARARQLYSFLTFFMVGAGIGANSIRLGMNILKQQITKKVNSELR
jgi:hypothetical protein